jgi:hypothetical protein
MWPNAKRRGAPLLARPLERSLGALLQRALALLADRSGLASPVIRHHRNACQFFARISQMPAPDNCVLPVNGTVGSAASTTATAAGNAGTVAIYLARFQFI